MFRTSFQDVIIHGQDIRSVRKSIGDINPDYQVFSDTGSFAPDVLRKLNYTGWGASGQDPMDQSKNTIREIDQHRECVSSNHR
jgi:hypothetical protein